MEFCVFCVYIDLDRCKGAMFGRVSDLDLRQVRVFLAIARAGGIVPAQHLLNVGQSTISSQLAALETRLGYRLCERGRSGFALTPRGERFLEVSRRLLSSIEDFELRARHLDKALVGSLTLGLIGHNPVEANATISAAIARFQDREQAVRLAITVRSPSDLEEMLLAGTVDVAIGYFWRRLVALDYQLLNKEEQRAYCGSEHPLFDRAGKVTFEEADHYSWAWRNYPLSEQEIPHLPPDASATSENMEAIAVLILSGRYLGYLPRHFAEPYVRSRQLAEVNPNLMRYNVDFHLVTRSRRHRGEIVDAFLDDLKGVIEVSPTPQEGQVAD